MKESVKRQLDRRTFVHSAAAAAGVPWWEDMVTGPEKPIHQRGFASPSDRPGLGIELVEEVVKAHLKPGHAVLRAHAGVGHRAVLGPAVELT
jgi:L-alanine-DL-glutamate epimerase-like enolase superfamily enzyme